MPIPTIVNPHDIDQITSVASLDEILIVGNVTALRNSIAERIDLVANSLQAPGFANPCDRAFGNVPELVQRGNIATAVIGPCPANGTLTTGDMTNPYAVNLGSDISLLAALEAHPSYESALPKVQALWAATTRWQELETIRLNELADAERALRAERAKLEEETAEKLAKHVEKCEALRARS